MHLTLAPPTPMEPDQLAEPLFAWLRSRQIVEPGIDQGAISDPLDERVPGEHYAATHFAWHCALRFHECRAPGLLDAAKQAIDFHLRTSPTEYSSGGWSYHWDFNNLAFVETYLLLDPHLSEDERQEWTRGLAGWKINAHWAVNWVAMRALAHFKRLEALGRTEDKQEAEGWLTYALGAQLADGGIWDVADQSLPSQYHAYSACLLHRMSGRHPSVPGAVRRAARWLLAITAPDGEMNAVGRGQGQIFGYACAVYLFRAAIALDPESAPQYRWAEQAVLARLARFQTPEGWWPLVLNPLPVKLRAGWYDYHHSSVYNAFAAVWLTLAAAIAVPPGPVEAPAEGETWLEQSGLLAVRRKRWFVLFGAGHRGAGYHTEPGITPYQIHWEGKNLFHYPLGPGTGKYGQIAAGKEQQLHCWAPLWHNGDGRWRAPSGADGSLKQLPGRSRWRLSLATDDAVWQRELTFGRCFLEARDVMTLRGHPPESSPVIRQHNFALDSDGGGETGTASARELGSGAMLTTWGASGLTPAGSVESAAGVSQVLASDRAAPAPSGWRLRQGPAETPGQLPGIVCLSWDPWSQLWKRKQRLLFELARSGRSPRTLFVEPATSITRIVEGWGHAGKLERERYRRCLLGKSEYLGHGLHVASPLQPWPLQRTLPGLARANHRSTQRQLHRFLDQVPMPEGYVLWLYHPSQLDALDALGHGAELVVYDWTDDWPAALPANWPDRERRLLEERQQELLQRADLVFAVSQNLVERAGRWCPNVHYLPNATDPKVFRPSSPGAAPHPLTGRRPALVYLSQITERLDVGLVGELARMRPDWTIILAGPVVCDPGFVAALAGLKNVILAGALPYDQAALLVAQSDVCILPHTRDELTQSLDPIKLYDYLATGRPVVSTPVSMHPDLAGLVYLATGAKGFASAVESALAEPAQESLRRVERMKNHTWAARADQAASVLERFFPQD